MVHESFFFLVEHGTEEFDAVTGRDIFNYSSHSCYKNNNSSHS